MQVTALAGFSRTRTGAVFTGPRRSLVLLLCVNDLSRTVVLGRCTSSPTRLSLRVCIPHPIVLLALICTALASLLVVRQPLCNALYAHVRRRHWRAARLTLHSRRPSSTALGGAWTLRHSCLARLLFTFRPGFVRSACVLSPIHSPYGNHWASSRWSQHGKLRAVASARGRAAPGWPLRMHRVIAWPRHDECC